MLTSSEIKRRLRRAEWRGRLKAIGLVVPLLLFLLVFFIIPIGRMLWLSVDNSELPGMPRFTAAIQQWKPEQTPIPDEATLAIFAEELQQAAEARELAGVARRLNTEVPGFRTTIMGTARRLPQAPEGTWAETFVSINSDWAETESWLLMQRAASPLTPYYLLASIDLRMGAEGLTTAPADQAIYRGIFARTFVIAGGVTLFCLLLGYPLAYKLASLPSRIANLLLILVLLPFWTSLLVRTTSWIVLLQQQGPINQFLQGVGLTSDPLQLIYNRFGVYVAMTHILLPFMVLLLYSVMRGINLSPDPRRDKPRRSPLYRIPTRYLPMTVPGIGAGCSPGVHPIHRLLHHARPGRRCERPDGQLVHSFLHQPDGQLGHGIRPGSILLISVLLIYWLYIRLVGVERMRLG